jgi:DNA helicase-2/ATP-dependent DNA helicase PcrA
MQKYLNELSDAQREAVLAKDGPSLIVAGAGSGKTRVLTYRIAHLLSSGVAPWNILSLTFTNKAAREMKNRINSVVGKNLGDSLWMGTFHSIFSRILRMESDKIGFPSTFTIYDTADSKSLIKSIIKDMRLDDKEYKPASVLSRISMAKNNLITPSAYKADSGVVMEDQKRKQPEIFRIYQRYANRCRNSGALDFDDLLLYTNILFRDNPDILDKYRQKFKYILVDEYQDTNFSQYLIVKKLSEQHKNICVVGDDAQSIYSFRGAKIENILKFKDNYPNHKLFKLEQNYRSTQNIVNAANSLIQNNEHQIKKNIFSENSEGELINIIEAYTDKEEGYLVVKDILEQINKEGLSYKDFAILYRTNVQSRIFEEALRKNNIPNKIYGGLSFYQRKEIKDFVAYFRIVVNSKDSEALKRVINFPARGIGATTLSKIENYANSNDVSMWDAISNVNNIELGLNKGTQSKIINFVQLIKSFQEASKTNDAYDLARIIGTESKLLAEYNRRDVIEEQTKYDNVQELLNGIRDFVTENHNEGNPTKLENFLENVALLTDQDSEKDDDNNKVTLMTIHSAKGLEFPQVYIVGVEEELFPSERSVYSQKELEEERRLFYVALTRAEQRVTISNCKSRYKYNKLISPAPSRFIKEIDKRFIISKKMFGGNSFNRNEELLDSSNTANKDKLFKKTISSGLGMSASRKLKQIKQTSTNFKYDKIEDIKSGMTVEHQQFGMGKIIQIEGTGTQKKAVVFFTKFGEKKCYCVLLS